MTGFEAGRPSLASVFARIDKAAPDRDQGGGDLEQEIGWLHEAGALVEALPEAITGVATWSESPPAVVGLLRALGRASLAVGRLFEGHVNTGQLIGLYGTPALQSRCFASVNAGGLLGVWGADGPEPVRAEETSDGFRLQGSKIFCSGLGLVGIAVISAELNGHTSLFAVDVRDPQRSDHTQWRVSGMRGTQSGGYDFDMIKLPPDAMLGKSGDYYVEPYFLGGMYRMCAVQIGGLDALMDGLTASLRRRGKSASSLAQHRVGRLACLRSMAIAVTERLAQMLSASADPADISREAILAREGVEWCIVESMNIVERSAGTEAHREAMKISLVRRDLSFYIRQGAIDERLASVGAWCMADDLDGRENNSL